MWPLTRISSVARVCLLQLGYFVLFTWEPRPLIDSTIYCWKKQQRVAVGPGNAHFISIRQASSDAATLRRGTCGDCCMTRFCCCCSAGAAVYRQFDDCRLIIINQLGLNLKICHDTIVENIVFNLYVKFNDDRLWNEKALVLWISDNINPKNKHKNNNNNNVGSALGPVSGSKIQSVYSVVVKILKINIGVDRNLSLAGA